MKTLFQAFKIPETRKKIFVVLFLLAVFRLFAAIPIPGIDAAQLRNFLAGNQFFGFLNLFAGGGLDNLSIMMLGVGPYITATIVMQLLTMIFPNLKELYYEQGAIGRAKFNRISRWLTVPFSALQGYGLLNLFQSQGIIGPFTLTQTLQNVLIITAGSIFLMWLGELMSEQKIGNGISLIIFAGIIAQLPSAIQTVLFSYSEELLVNYLVFAALAVIVTAGIVFVSEGERKIPVVYSKRVRGNKMYGGTSTYLPLKVNQAGVIPIIFAISILLFPQFLAQILTVFSGDFALTLQAFLTGFTENNLAYGLVYFFLVAIFTYFYTAITFNPEELSKNLQHGGGFIPGIRPGKPTEQYLKSTTGKITLFGALFLGLVAVLPIITQSFTNTNTLTIGGTALLIVVSVGLETYRQIESQVSIRQY